MGIVSVGAAFDIMALSRIINSLSPEECAMFTSRSFPASAAFFSALLLLQACGDAQKSTAPAAPVEESTVADAESGGPAAPTENTSPAGASNADTTATAKDAGRYFNRRSRH